MADIEDLLNRDGTVRISNLAKRAGGEVGWLLQVRRGDEWCIEGVADTHDAATAWMKAWRRTHPPSPSSRS